ncbi:membrane bound O-acyl transferase family-domain-containing protein [Aspergillus aurantiobrunneus]
MSSVSQHILQLLVSIITFFLSVAAFRHLANVPYRQRIIFSPLLYIPAALSFATADSWPGDLNGLWGLLLCIWAGHSTSVLFIEDPRFLEPREPKLWNNPRLLGTSFRDVKGSTPSARSPVSVARFTIMRLGKLAAYTGIYYAVTTWIFPAAFIPMHIDEFGPAHQRYFRRLPLLPGTAAPAVGVTLRETLLRCAFIIWWLLSAAGLLDATHAAISLVAVSLLHFDEPSEWPDLFGSPSLAYTIRRFWSKFWHQIVRRTYTNYGKCVSRNLLRLTPCSLLDRIVVILVTFFLSGVSHAAVSWLLGDRCGWALDIWWFCVNFVAGFLEAGAVLMLRVVLTRIGKGHLLERLGGSAWGRVLGFIWVFAFMFWSIPKWQYPKLYCRLGGV